VRMLRRFHIEDRDELCREEGPFFMAKCYHERFKFILDIYIY
jgi:hypothetical protein